MAQNKLVPARPIDTFSGFKKGIFKLPDILESSDKIQVDKSNVLEFYTKIPSIKDFKAYDGYKVQAHIKGGETEGRNRLDKFCDDQLKVVNFRKPMTVPTSLRPDTTAVSAHLKFGSLSIRTFYW